MTQVKAPQLSFKNHFQFGYDGNPFAWRSSQSQQWYAKYGKCALEPLNFHDECVRTAKTIADATNEKIFVTFSGGSDSEVTLRSFVKAGVQVEAAILRFKKDLNIHDISWAVIVCEELKVPYKFYDLDLLEFWGGEADSYAESTYCISPQLLSTMWLMDQIPGYPVMGSGECLLVKDRPTDYIPGVSPYLKSEWYLWEKEKIAAWYRYFIWRNRDACPGFFQYTPEIIKSYIKDPFVQNLVNDRIEGKLSTESSKLKIYQQHFPLMNRPKYTGFEKVQAEDARYRAKLLERNPHSNQVHKTAVSDLMKL